MNVTFIFNQTQLNDCVKDLSTQKQIALDLEFDNNRYRHGFTLCLIQVATEKDIYVIDPFNRVDLTEFYRLLERKDQQIVVFEFGEDLVVPMFTVIVLQVLLQISNMSETFILNSKKVP